MKVLLLFFFNSFKVHSLQLRGIFLNIQSWKKKEKKRHISDVLLEPYVIQPKAQF